VFLLEILCAFNQLGSKNKKSTPPKRPFLKNDEVFKELSVSVSSWRSPWANDQITARHAQQLWAPHLAAGTAHAAWLKRGFMGNP